MDGIHLADRVQPALSWEHEEASLPHPAMRDRDEPPLRICMLAACPFPANYGTPGSVRELGEAIVERGHQVHLVTYHVGEDIPVRGIQVHRIAPLLPERGVFIGPNARRPLYDLQMVFKARHVIREHGADLIHAHGHEAALVGWLCRLLTGRPLVYSAHMTMADELQSYGVIRPRCLAPLLARMLDSIVPRLADRRIPHSENLARFFERMGLKTGTEPVIHKGIDVDWAARGDGTTIREEYGLGSDPAILYTGLLEEFQRPDLLLEAMTHVAKHDPRARLVVVQTVPSERHKADLLRRATDLGIVSRVVLTDPQPLPRIRDFIQACDVAVVSRTQGSGFAIKVLNYLAASKPCVLFASSASGLTHRQTAYLVQSDTGEALAEGILEVLRNPELSQALARNGYHYVREHRDRRVIARLVCEVYYRTLAAYQRRPIGQGRLALLPESEREEKRTAGAAN